jgi:hypothetical protein
LRVHIRRSKPNREPDEQMRERVQTTLPLSCIDYFPTHL